MKIHGKILLVLFAIICLSFIFIKKQIVGNYIGYTKGLSLEIIDNKINKLSTLVSSKFTFNSDGTFELIYPDVSIRPNKTQGFFSYGTYEIIDDTLVLNSHYQYSDFITVEESKKDFCNNNILGIEVKYSEYHYNPTYIIDERNVQKNRKLDTSFQRFNKINIEFVDSNFEYDQEYYSVSDSKPSFFRNTNPLQLKLSRFHPSIRHWVYKIKDSSSNYLQCILKSDINGQNLVLENERFLILDTLLIHLNESFLKIDTFKMSK